MVCTAFISKSLRILYQISKVFLNLAKAILSAMTLPLLLNSRLGWPTTFTVLHITIFSTVVMK